MTTPAQGNFPESSAKLEGGFEAPGLSPEEADRLAASFKPSWEFDEAPFTDGAALHGGNLEALEASGVAREVHRHSDKHPDSGRSHTVPAHAPPARVETHEPEVSVIIDRSITAAQVEARAPAAAAPAAVPAPFALPPVSPNRVVAPVARSRFNADESLELPASLKKSNKGLFIGLGAAVAAAVLVFAVRAAMSSQDEPEPSSTALAATAAPTPPHATPIPPPPPLPAPPAAATVPAPQVQAAASHAAAPAPAPKPAPHAAAPTHHAAAPPRTPPPKAPSGGIVRDVPF